MKNLLNELNNKAASLYSMQLDNNADALKYAESRGLSRDTLSHFGIGFAPDAWNEFSKSLDSEDEINTALTGGLVAKSEKGRVYDFFRNRLMFPIKSADGNVVGFGGRDLAKESRVKYLNSPETPLFKKNKTLFNLDTAKQYQDMVIVEGYMDVVKAYEKGLPNFTATLGTAFTHDHAEVLASLNLRSVTFSFDGDKAGYNAALSTLSNCAPLAESGVTMRFAFMPDGLDPDDVLESQGRSSFVEILNNALSPAAFIVKHNIESLYQEYQEPPIDLALSRLTDAAELCDKSGIKVEELKNEIHKVAPNGTARACMESYLESHTSGHERNHTTGLTRN